MHSLSRHARALMYLATAVAPRAWGANGCSSLPRVCPCSFICVTRELLAAVFATRCAIRGTRVGVGSKTCTWPLTATQARQSGGCSEPSHLKWPGRVVAIQMRLWAWRSRCADRVMAASRDNAMRSSCGSLNRRAHEDGGMRLLPHRLDAGGRQCGVPCVRPASLVEPLLPA